MILKTIILVKKVRPHVLLGLSGVGGIFNEEVLKAMKESVSTKPAIFAMSSPTMNAECTAIDAFKHAGGDIVFGSGSPFENVDLGNWKSGSCKSGQQHVSVPRNRSRITFVRCSANNRWNVAGCC
ncbi:hypothetical protein S245_003136 [Arachis hypogaea]